jgi:hypothetical protein
MRSKQVRPRGGKRLLEREREGDEKQANEKKKESERQREGDRLA